MHMKFPLFAIALAALSLPCLASEFIATNVYVVGKDTVVADEQWVLAGIAETEGTFGNDLFIMSGNPLNLNGRFEGNVWAAASVEANFAGECGRNLRTVAGKSVVINGTVDGNVMAMGETVIVSTNALIRGNARLAGTSVILEGRIEGNVSLSSARLATIDGTIGGNARMIAPEILLQQDARIGGNLEYTASREIMPAEGVVGGALSRVQPKPEPLFSAAKLTSKTMWYLAALLAGIPFITLFPMTTAMASQLVRRAPWKCLFAGMLASGALPIFGIMSVSSLIGVPLGVLLLASWGILAYLSRIIMGLVIGTMVLRKTGTSIGKVLLALALGLAAIYLSALVPAIGVPVQFMVLWLGMGSLILSLLEKRKLILQVPQNLKKLEEMRNENHNPEETQP